jgi:hypothetical protein
VRHRPLREPIPRPSRHSPPSAPAALGAQMARIRGFSPDLPAFREAGSFHTGSFGQSRRAGLSGRSCEFGTCVHLRRPVITANQVWASLDVGVGVLAIRQWRRAPWPRVEPRPTSTADDGGSVEGQRGAGDFAGLQRPEGLIDVAEPAARVRISIITSASASGCQIPLALLPSARGYSARAPT